MAVPDFSSLIGSVSRAKDNRRPQLILRVEAGSDKHLCGARAIQNCLAVIFVRSFISLYGLELARPIQLAAIAEQVAE